MPDVKLTESEKKAQRSIGKKAYADMVLKVGKKKLAAIARKQGHHGVKGGRPQLYKKCPHYTDGRHKFFHDNRCRCGQERLTS